MSLLKYLNPNTIKDGSIEVSKIISLAQSITWGDLKSKRDARNLIPGTYYRITDYQCTTTQNNTKSAGHQFDIIIRADDARVLNEEAIAVKHEGDTYFANSNLSAWKIWYCLDNDTERFAWADPTNGKGVIYRMIDEFNNDIPYDFKNIQFKHPNNTTKYPYYYYTFASRNIEANTDLSLDAANDCYSNIIKKYRTAWSRAGILNNIIFIGRGCYNNFFGLNCYNNIFDGTCHDNTFGGSCYNNTFGDLCYNNTFGYGCSYNTFGHFCTDNTFIFLCSNNTFGKECSDNTFGKECHDNTFDNKCYANSFGPYCQYNSLGSYCSNNTFGNDCSHINFASDGSASSKYNYYQYNHFGDGCAYLIFKGTETASGSHQVQNYNFSQGLQGTDNAYLTIDGVRGRSFETKVAKNSNGELKVYCEADLIL